MSEMSDFSANIRAIIDTKDIPKQLENIGEKSTVTLRNFKLDTSRLPSEIQASLDKHRFKISLDGIKTSNIGQIENAGNKAGQAFSQSLINRINSQISNGNIEASIAKVTAQYEKLGATGHAKLADVKKDLEQLNALQSTISSAKDSTVLVTNYERFNDTLSRVKNNLTTVSAESRSFASSLQIKTLDNEIAAWMENNSKASRDYGASIDSLRGRLSALDTSGTATVYQLKEVKQEFNQIKQAAISVGQTGTAVGSQLEGAFQSILRYVSVSSIIYQSINAFKQMYHSVYDIDTEMTELRKVTNENAESYSNFLRNTASSSKDIGTTIKDLISSTADFARLGYSFADSQELAKAANIYSVVGDEIGSIDTATKSLISTMTAFSSQMDSSMSQGEFALSIIDKFNEIGKIMPKYVVTRRDYSLLVAISVKSQKWSRPRKDLVFVK